MYFGYTHCTDTCPLTLSELAHIRRTLPPSDRSRFVVAFVTVDPARDDRARLGAYVRAFDPHFVGLTGSKASLARVYDAYRIWSQRLPGQNAAAYLEAHSGTLYLIAPDGSIGARHAWRDAPAAIGADVKRFLNGRSER